MNDLPSPSFSTHSHKTTNAFFIFNVLELMCKGVFFMGCLFSCSGDVLDMLVRLKVISGFPWAFLNLVVNLGV